MLFGWFFDEYGFATNIHFWIAPIVVFVALVFAVLRVFGRTYGRGLMLLVLCVGVVAACTGHATYRPSSGQCLVWDEEKHVRVCGADGLRQGGRYVLTDGMAALNLLATHPTVVYPAMKQKYKECAATLLEKGITQTAGRVLLVEELYVCKHMISGLGV